MPWIWEQPDWPDFAYDPRILEPLERQFLVQSGELMGITRHVSVNDQATLRVELISDEAVMTSAIEGEMLDRASVQSSLRNQFGLSPEQGNVTPAERGIAHMMVDLYEHFPVPLADATMFAWHRMILSGDTTIKTIGGYRTHADPMQVVSGPIQRRKVHFEGPPSRRVPHEMKRFIAWFNDTAPQGPAPLPALTRAGLAHLYFECIHPFEDGNGRIGRAIAEKSLAQNLGYPSLIALSYTIERRRNAYYSALERNSRDVEVSEWLEDFARTILDAQATTIKRVDFHIAKAKFHDRMHSKLNDRQAKVIARMFREGIDGFKGGLSAENYISITGTSRATATRDLRALVEWGALARSGELRHTRYALVH